MTDLRDHDGRNAQQWHTEFTSRAFDAWATVHKIRVDFIRPGRPVENAFIESFNGRLREECLNQSYFLDMADVRLKLEIWQKDYNEVRPHSSLADLAPLEYARTLIGAQLAAEI